MDTIGRRIAGVILCVMVLSACGDTGDAELTSDVPLPQASVTTVGATLPPVAPGTVRTACELLTQDDVARAVGNPVRAGTGQDKYCFWGTTVDKGTSANLTVTRPAPNRANEECTVQRNALAKESQHDPVSNVGTSAVWAWQRVSILLQGAFLACWPDAVILVNLSGEKDQTALRDNAASIAETVHGRL